MEVASACVLARSLAAFPWRMLCAAAAAAAAAGERAFDPADLRSESEVSANSASLWAMCTTCDVGSLPPR